MDNACIFLHESSICVLKYVYLFCVCLSSSGNNYVTSWNRYGIGNCFRLRDSLLLLSFSFDLLRGPLKGDEVV